MKQLAENQRRMMRACFLMFIFFTFLVPQRGVSGELEKGTLLDRALASIAAKRSDLAIRSDLSDNPFAFNRFYRWMEKPDMAPVEAQQDIKDLFNTADDPEAWLKSLAGISDIAISETLPIKNYEHEIPFPLLPVPLRKAIQTILDAMYTANQEVDVLKNSISPEKRLLIDTFLNPGECLYKETIEEPEKSDRYKEVKEALKAASTVDKTRIAMSAVTLLRALAKAKSLLTETVQWNEEVTSFSFKTDLGMVSIGGTGPDRHSGGSALIIDLGGDDLYEGRVASGNDGKSGIVLDLAGNDVYLGGDCTQGSGNWGIGILIDLKGDDLYRAGNYAQGVGFFGVGLLIDGGGRDQYLGGRYVQAASSWGWGGLLDLGDEDIYQCERSGQAYAGVSGGSCLLDLGGDDKYISGIGAPDPREPDMNQSFAQGFSFGMRDMAAGGYAILADKSGNDLYQCQYFGQGASYWMGIGLLYDGRGKDTYIAHRYAQGAGIHFSLGLLLDSSGDDRTVSWGVSQGCGHDYGIGLFINESGNDTYSSDWLSMGASEANGVGVFIDNNGDDGYITRSGLAVGKLIPSRRAGGIGLFLDAGGQDGYAGRGGDNQSWGSNRWSVGMDCEEKGISGLNIQTSMAQLPMSRALKETMAEEKRRLRENLTRSERMTLHDKVEILLPIATHWGFENTIPGEAQERILSLDPKESLPIMAALLDTPDLMTLIFLEKVFTIYAFHARQILKGKLSDPDPLIQSRTLYYLGNLKDSRDLKDFFGILTHPSWKVRAIAIRAIGEILNRERLDILIPMKKALDDAAGEHPVPVLESFLINQEHVNQLLSVLVRAFPMDYETYKKYKEKTGEGEKSKRLDSFVHLVSDHLNETHALLKIWIHDINRSWEQSERLMEFLHDPDPAVKRAAAYALGQMAYLPAIPELLDLLKDNNLWVRDAAALSLALFGEKALSPIVWQMGNEPTSFKIIALDIIAGIKGTWAKEILMEYIQNPDENIQRAAKQALEKHERQS